MRFSARAAGLGVPRSGGIVKLLLAGLVCLTLAVPGYGQRPHTKKNLQAKNPAPVAPVVPTPPPTLAQVPASAPKVAFQSGELTISAENSTLGDILKAVQSQTGAQVDFPGSATERVVGSFGPGPARDVLTSLLNGSHFNYLLLGSPTDPNALDRVILMAKSSASVDNNPPQLVEQANTYQYNQQTYARPMAAPMAATGAGANTVVVEGQDAQDDGTATDDSADATDDTQADDQTDQTDDQTTDDTQATDDTQQQQPEGQPNVKTPEQLLQELQRQQQIQQQGGQPGLPQIPQPGFPPGMQPGQPPHN